MRRFSLRCLGNGIIPVSIRLKNNVRTQRSDIIQRAKRSLLNERIREVNITLDQLQHDTYMYESKLSAIISQDHMVECKEFIKEHKELRHKVSHGKAEKEISQVDKLIFSKKQNNFFVERQAFARISIMASSRSEEMLM